MRRLHSAETNKDWCISEGCWVRLAVCSPRSHTVLVFADRSEDMLMCVALVHCLRTHFSSNSHKVQDALHVILAWLVHTYTCTAHHRVEQDVTDHTVWQPMAIGGMPATKTYIPWVGRAGDHAVKASIKRRSPTSHATCYASGAERRPDGLAGRMSFWCNSSNSSSRQPFYTTYPRGIGPVRCKMGVAMTFLRLEISL